MPHASANTPPVLGQRRVLRQLFWLLTLSFSGVLLVGLILVRAEGYTLRQWANWIQSHETPRHPRLSGLALGFADQLIARDRGEQVPRADYPARPAFAASAPQALREVRVGDAKALTQALADARAGDVITLAPGTYAFDGKYLAAHASGLPDAPITLRAEQLGSVRLDFNMLEGFHVNAPHWRFENLEIHGTCAHDSDCEHAFHIVGAAEDVQIIRCRLVDFNAAIKVNGEGGKFPDKGVVINSELIATHARNTGNPVTPIDLVAASGWRIEGNLIADFVKLGGDHVSYGAFVKGGGKNNMLARNLVLCEQRLRGLAGQRVGLSLGGGGTDHGVCRDKRCIVEQEGGALVDNRIAQCSDVGIYLNRAAQSHLSGNRLLDTAGIEARYPETAALLQNNWVDGLINARDEALLHESGDLRSGRTAAMLGLHSLRPALCQSTPEFASLALCQKP